ncbi:ATP-binding protein [uncultured Bacteroides sp.]|uniref:ATP-binding protein n=1 Tax=uncultured Bacteroides sp. TaxID=162156 RepID=UPI002AAABB1E|nr:ATP-binding protein [uncultured Bacteroides sp.]
MMGRINLENLKPHPKNPTIANVFKQIGWVEELGSGVCKMYKYCPIYVNGALPVIEEGDVFKITLKYEKEEIVNEGVNKPLSENEVSIISLLKINPGLKANEISTHIDKSLVSVERYVTSLKKKNLIEFRDAPKTGGYYIKTEKKEEK